MGWGPLMMFRFVYRFAFSAVILSSGLALTGCGGGLTAGSPNTSQIPATPATPAATGASTASPLRHVVVVVFQNSTFDHLFGTFPAANGNTVEGIRPTGLGYTQIDANGNQVSPFLLSDSMGPNLPEGRQEYLNVLNSGHMDKFAFYNGDVAMGYYDGSTPGMSILWGYAQQFALADQYFSSVIGEAPTNQLYMVAASDMDRTFSVQPFYGPCALPDPSAVAYTFPNVADQLFAKGISWGTFQEQLGNCGHSQPIHNPFQFFSSTHQSPNIQDYSQFSVQLQGGTLPAVSLVIPRPADDLHPGFNEPLLTGLTFLQNLVQQVQNSLAWSTTAIIVTFDDGGGWYDHVPPPQIDSQGLGFRVPTLVISPYAKKGYVSHKVMDHVSILKLIQWNWSLPSLNARNDASGDMLDMFQF